MKLSREQNDVLHALQTSNVVVQANPGAGKTTTACAAAMQYPSWRTLLITYSSRLKEETRRRVSDSEINQLKVHSYHSCARWMTGCKGYTDEMLRLALQLSFKAECQMDLLILDEMQDQTWLYFELVCKVLGVFKPRRVLVLGDTRQCVFSFKGADARFLTRISSIIPNATEMRLATSFRMTRQIAEFVNKVLLKRTALNEESIVCDREGEKVIVCTCNMFCWETAFIRFFMEQIKYYGAGETFVLAPSVRLRNRHIAALQGHLVDAGVPVYFPLFEDGLGKEEAMRNKVVFSSFHGSKGRERRLVFVLGFDMGYDTYYNNNAHVCSNPMYVAATRAKDKLIMICSRNEELPKYVNANHLHEVCDTKGFAVIRKKGTKGTTQGCTVTELISYVSESTAAKLEEMVKNMYTQVRQKTHNICIPCTLVHEGSEEEVSSITSLLINDSLQQACINSSEHEEAITKFQTSPKDYDVPNKDFIMLYLKDMGEAKCNVNWMVRRTLVYNAISDSETFRLAQVRKFDWISQTQLDNCVNLARQNLCITADSKFEYKLSKRKEKDCSCAICNATERECGIRVHISARTDVITETAVIENKATSEEAIQHFLQLIVYKYIWGALDHDSKKQFILYYQLTGATYELVATNEQCASAVHLLLENKYCNQDTCSDEVFERKARELYTSFYQ